MNQKHRLFPPILSPSDRKKWLNGEHLGNINIYIGHHEGVLGLNPAPNTAAEITTDGNIQNLYVSGKTISFVIAHLAVCIVIGVSNKKIASNFYNLSNSKLDIKWSKKYDIDYMAIADLHNNDIEKKQHVALANMMMNKKHRREVENFSRKKHTLAFPPHLESVWINQYLNQV